MSIPTLTNTLDGVDICWDDNPFVFKMNQLRAHRDGRITGFLSVHSNNKKELEFVYPSTQINIVADRTRASLIKALESRTSANWQWEDIVFQFSQLVQDYVRAGEPAIEMWAGLEETKVEPPSYLIYPLLAEDLPNVIFGKRGTVKSTMALAIVSLLVLGSRDNSLKISATKEIRSLYLDYELNYKALNYQFFCVQQGLGIPPVMLTYRRCYLPIAQDIEQIMHWIEKTRSQLLVIDSAAPACGGEPEKAGPVIEMFSAIRRLNITTLIIGHTSHEDEGKEKHMFGSVFFENEARNIWESRIIQEAGDTEVDLGLFHTKPPPFSGKQKPLGFHFSFQPSITTIESRDPKNIDEFVQRMGNNQRILHYLKTGAYLPKEIADALTMNPGSVRVSLGRLEDKKLVVKIGEKYGLLSK